MYHYAKKKKKIISTLLLLYAKDLNHWWPYEFNEPSDYTTVCQTADILHLDVSDHSTVSQIR